MRIPPCLFSTAQPISGRRRIEVKIFGGIYIAECSCLTNDTSKVKLVYAEPGSVFSAAKVKEFADQEDRLSQLLFKTASAKMICANSTKNVFFF